MYHGVLQKKITDVGLSAMLIPSGYYYKSILI